MPAAPGAASFTQQGTGAQRGDRVTAQSDSPALGAGLRPQGCFSSCRETLAFHRSIDALGFSFGFPDPQLPWAAQEKAEM